MGWFDEQIEFRKKLERQQLNDSFDNIYRAITGRGIRASLSGDSQSADDAIARLLKYFGIRQKDVPAKLKDLEDKLDYLISSSGLMYREVTLTKGWHTDATGAMITTLRQDGTVVAILPGKMGGYVYTDPKTGKTVKITSETETLLGEEAWCFYRPLPMRKLKVKDLFTYMVQCLNSWDYVSFALSALLITLVGVITTRLNKILVGTVVEYGSTRLLIAAMSFLLCASLGALVFNIIKSLLLNRIYNKLSLSVQAATMMRVLSLPPGFFRQYSAGELNQYVSYMNSLCGTLVNSVLSSGVTGVFSLIYITQIFSFASSLVLPSLLITLLTVALSLISSFMQIPYNQEHMTLAAREKGLVYSLINGIQKLRLSGAENRAFVKWTELYARDAGLVFDAPALIKLNKVFTSVIGLTGTGIMYYIAVKSKVSMADYYAFNAAYGYISTAFTAVAGVLLTAASIKPSIKILTPLLDAEPETEENKETVLSLSGSIELAHVSFRYDKESPLIIDDLNLTIPARQYVAIVGRTGCGKSTLMRLLLGFEKPDKGAIYYDRHDLQRMDMRSVRKLIGTVMQDGKIFGGSIFENITITSPMLGLKEAWEAAEVAGLADDIRLMPMGMNTILQEGMGGISGGQRQRLMIARAVAPKPKILMFDEATSALDNITQKKVSDALDKMRCTRIVIAHRLSTIRHCDRILVLDKGKIIEDGTYDELIAQNGYFAELVKRQRLDSGE